MLGAGRFQPPPRLTWADLGKRGASGPCAEPPPRRPFLWAGQRTAGNRQARRWAWPQSDRVGRGSRLRKHKGGPAPFLSFLLRGGKRRDWRKNFSPREVRRGSGGSSAGQAGLSAFSVNTAHRRLRCCFAVGRNGPGLHRARVSSQPAQDTEAGPARRLPGFPSRGERKGGLAGGGRGAAARRPPAATTSGCALQARDGARPSRAPSSRGPRPARPSPAAPAPGSSRRGRSARRAPSSGLAKAPLLPRPAEGAGPPPAKSKAAAPGAVLRLRTVTAPTLRGLRRPPGPGGRAVVDPRRDSGHARSGGGPQAGRQRPS